MTIPIYCINLPEHTGRKSVIEEQAQKLGLNITFFQSINGNKIPKAERFTCCRSHPYRASYHHPNKDYVNLMINNNFHLFNSNLLKGEVGLAITLLVLYHKLASENVDWVIIIEDDVIFAENFPEHLQKIAADLPHLAENNVDIVFINDRMHRHQEAPVADNLLNRYFPVKGGFGFDGYLLSKSGMIKLIHLYNPLIYPVDLQVVPHLQRYEPKYPEKNLVKPGFIVNGYKYYTNLIFHTIGESSIARSCPEHCK